MVGVIAIGQTLIILTAGIDLSCGMVMALGSIVMTKFASDLGVPAPLAILCGIGVTALFGLINGLLVTRISCRPSSSRWAPSTSRSPSHSFIRLADHHRRARGHDLAGPHLLAGGANVAYGTVLMIGLYLGVWFWLRETAAGRHVYAVGNNPEATRLVGIPTERVLLGVYVLAGVFYGIASLLAVARTGVGDRMPGRPRTWTRSPRWCWAAPACSAAAA